MNSAKARVCIIGAGAAGLALAFALSSKGIKSLICDAGKAGQGAISASAGMIAAGVEAAESLDPALPIHRAFYTLARHSAQVWPQWAAALEAVSGIDVGYAREGAIIPGGDAGRLVRIKAGAQAFGVPVKLADGRSLCPEMADEREALFLPDEAGLDPRALADALVAAARRSGVEILEDAPAVSLLEEGGRTCGTRLSDGREIRADAVVVAAGWAASRLHPVAADLEPVKGQILLFDAGRDVSTWPLIRGGDVYLAPQPGGYVMVGASVEPGRSDLAIDDEARDRLIMSARALVPDMVRWRRLGHWAGIRPALPGHMPLVGQVAPGLYVSIGAYRNGILLAPAIAEGLAQEIAGEGMQARLAPFAPATVNEGLSSHR